MCNYDNVLYLFNYLICRKSTNMAKENKEYIEKQPLKGKAAYMEYMKGRNPEFNGEDEESVYEDMLSYRRDNDDSRAKMTEALMEDPRMAQVLGDVANKRRGAGAAFARYYGRDMLNAKEGTPEWDEIQEAEKERNDELVRQRKYTEDYNANIDASMPVLEEFAKENDLNIDDFLTETYDKIVEPIFLGKYDKDLLGRLNKALNYDNDIEESFNAGKVAGMNGKIESMRKENLGDGMPRMGSTAAQLSKPAPEKKKPYRGSVWDD